MVRGSPVEDSSGAGLALDRVTGRATSTVTGQDGYWYHEVWTFTNPSPGVYVIDVHRTGTALRVALPFLLPLIIIVLVPVGVLVYLRRRLVSHQSTRPSSVQGPTPSAQRDPSQDDLVRSIIAIQAEIFRQMRGRGRP